MPIVMGIPNTRMIASAILLFTVLTLVYLFGAYLNFLPSGKFDYFTFAYLLVALIIPIFYLMVKLLSAQTKEDYHWASNFSKLIMLAGILYAIPFRLLIG
jgi:4-hydroxybenzoate polyprenyltransferase